MPFHLGPFSGPVDAVGANGDETNTLRVSLATVTGTGNLRRRGQRRAFPKEGARPNDDRSVRATGGRQLPYLVAEMLAALNLKLIAQHWVSDGFRQEGTSLVNCTGEHLHHSRLIDPASLVGDRRRRSVSTVTHPTAGGQRSQHTPSAAARGRCAGGIGRMPAHRQGHPSARTRRTPRTRRR